MEKSKVVSLKDAKSIVAYDKMCKAIAEAHRIDQVMDIENKAAAIAEYQRRAGNSEAEKLAKEIRTRATIRLGELLREIPKNPTRQKRSESGLSRTVLPNPGKERVLKEHGIRKDRASDAEKLANIPVEKREANFKSGIVTVQGMIKTSYRRGFAKEPGYDPTEEASDEWLAGFKADQAAQKREASKIYSRAVQAEKLSKALGKACDAAFLLLEEAKGVVNVASYWNYDIMNAQNSFMHLSFLMEQIGKFSAQARGERIK